MLQVDGHESFATSAALLVLDTLLHDAGALALEGTVPAWETAWIACLTNSPRWAGTARADFALVISELSAMVRLTLADKADGAAGTSRGCSRRARGSAERSVCHA